MDTFINTHGAFSKFILMIEIFDKNIWKSLLSKIPGTVEPGGLQSTRSLRLGQAERLPFHFSLSRIGEGNGSPVQCSCLENPRDGGAWWAAVCGVAQSRTRLQ